MVSGHSFLNLFSLWVVLAIFFLISIAHCPLLLLMGPRYSVWGIYYLIIVEFLHLWLAFAFVYQCLPTFFFNCCFIFNSSNDFVPSLCFFTVVLISWGCLKGEMCHLHILVPRLGFQRWWKSQMSHYYHHLWRVLMFTLCVCARGITVKQCACFSICYTIMRPLRFEDQPT